MRPDGRLTRCQERYRIVLASMLASVPDQGGWVWAAMQWALGLEALGHRVFLVEQVDQLDPLVRSRFDRLTASFGLADRSALVTPRGEAAPVDYAAVAGELASSDLLVNLGGVLRRPDLVEAPAARAYVDLDPVFTQLWDSQGIDVGLEGHTAYVTVGLNIGSDDCAAPTGGRAWITTLPPVVLNRWPAGPAVDYPGFTTVANWRACGSVEHQGVHYGQKAHSWRELLPIASLSRAPFMPALAIHPDEHRDIDALKRHRWRVLDPVIHAGSPGTYHRFVQTSLAELGVAKSGYVASRSGWFSDRSACYLAAGRPVLAQETGFSSHLPVGQGLLPFTGVESAVEGAARICCDYESHRSAARAIACDHLDARRVLDRVVTAVLGRS